jgi:drug/metabolite transporter (DMT)-like permease
MKPLAFISLCLIWGSTWLGIRVMVRDVPPFDAAAWRFLIAAGVLLVWAAFRKRWPRGEREWNAIVILVSPSSLFLTDCCSGRSSM